MIEICALFAMSDHPSGQCAEILGSCYDLSTENVDFRPRGRLDLRIGKGYSDLLNH